MSGLFASKPKPSPPPPEPTPMVDETAVANAKKKAALRVRASGGRESTILGSSDKLGG